MATFFFKLQNKNNKMSTEQLKYFDVQTIQIQAKLKAGLFLFKTHFFLIYD